MDFAGIFDRTGRQKKHIDRQKKAESMFRPEGITLDFGSGPHRFLAFERSASMSRQAMLSFIREDFFEPVRRRIMMDLTIGQCQLSKESPTAWYRCPTRGCDCKMIKCEVVENSIHEAMEDWLEKYLLEIEADQQPKADPIATALEAVRGQLAQLQLQQENICEYLEKGVYTIDMFTKRNASLTKEIKQLQTAEADLLRQQCEGSQKKQATVQIIPTTQHILENYPILTVAEKNRLWKLVMTKATVYRSPDSKLTVNIYPNLPK